MPRSHSKPSTTPFPPQTKTLKSKSPLKQESSRRRNINKLPTVPHRCLQPFEHRHSQSRLTGILWTHALDKGHQRQCPGLSSFLVFFFHSQRHSFYQTSRTSGAVSIKCFKKFNVYQRHATRQIRSQSDIFLSFPTFCQSAPVQG